MNKPPIQNSPPSTTSTKQVYLVEQNSDDIALARRAISTSGYTVYLEVLQTSRALKEAISESETTTRPDLLLIDLHLDTSSRDAESIFNLIRRLRQTPLTEHTPIVVIGSPGREHEILRCYAAGASSVIQKPVVFTEYATLLKEVCHYWLNISIVPDYRYIKPVNPLISEASA
ncbi:MAG: response regulator [Thioalkalispiraceae bacterium]|jgi:two-component system response regulator